MPVSKNRQFAKIANDVNTSGTLTAAAISSDVTLGGATIYASRSNLPSSGNTAGDQAFTTDTNRLYIWNGSGWYNVALLNVAPSIQSVLDSDGTSTPFRLSTEGATTTITITALDSDGDPITYAATSDSDFAGLATLSQADNVFTITPFSQDSATTTSGTITFTATDGINVASSGIQTFTLQFLSPYWDETVLSIGTSSTNTLDNSTFIDRSTNARTITPSGTPVQTAFNPYLENWSVHMPSGAQASVPGTNLAPGTSEFCIEGWVHPKSYGNLIQIISQWNQGTGQHGVFIGSNGYLYFYRGNYGSGEAYRRTSTAVPLNEWTHVAVTRDSSNVWRFFYNGVEQSTSVTSSGSVTWSDSVNLSSTQTVYLGGSSAYNTKDVYLSNLRLVIGDPVYTTNFTPPTENLTAISGTALLCYQDNTLVDNSVNNLTISTTTARVRAFNPFGQGSEYTSNANKGSLYSSATGSDRVSTTVGSGLVAGDFTIEGWFYADAVSGSYGTVINNGGTHASALALSYGDAGLYHRIYIGTLQRPGTSFTNGWMISTNKYALLGRWTHIAIVRDVGKIYLYLNGVKQYFAEWTSQSYVHEFITNTSTLDANFLVGGWQGYASDVKFTDSAVYTADFTLPTSPVSPTNADTYLPMDNAGIFDKTANNTLTLAGNTSTSTTQTKFANTAIYFDGNDWISWNSPSIGSGDFTMEGWFYLSGTAGQGSAGQQGIFCAGNHGGSSRWAIKLHNTTPGSNKVIAFWLNSYSNEIRGSTVINANQWYHYALVRSGSGSNNVKLYLDGTLEVQTTSTYSIPADTGSIGRNYPSLDGEYFNGYLENIQLLSGIAKYTTNFTPPTGTQGRTYQAES